MTALVNYEHTITDNFDTSEAQNIGDELYLFTLADGSTITSVYFPSGHQPPHMYRITGPSGAVLGELPSLHHLLELLDLLGLEQ